MTAASIPVWVTNVSAKILNETLCMYHRSDKDFTFITGKPHSTYRYSAAELEERSIVGIYAQRKQHG